MIASQVSCTVVHTVDLATPNKCACVRYSHGIARHHKVMATLFSTVVRTKRFEHNPTPPVQAPLPNTNTPWSCVNLKKTRIRLAVSISLAVSLRHKVVYGLPNLNFPPPLPKDRVIALVDIATGTTRHKPSSTLITTSL